MQAVVAFNAETIREDEEVNVPEKDGARDFWKLDKNIPVSFLYVILTAFVVGVLWVGNLSWTVGQHTILLTSINNTVQARGPAISSIENLSAQMNNLTTMVNSLAATNQRLSSTERDIAELRVNANSVATHERRIETLEESLANTSKALNDIGGRLAHIEAKLDMMQSSGTVRSR